MITRDNYELYFMDFFDGNLSFEEKELLLHFIEQNKDLKEEFEQFKNISISKENPEEIPNFEFLKKSLPINAQNEDNYFIADIEGDLTTEDKKNLILYLADNPLIHSKYNRYKKVKLETPSIFYPYKSKLKKNRVGILYYLSGISAAAAIVFFIWLPKINYTDASTKAQLGTLSVIAPPKVIIEKGSNSDSTWYSTYENTKQKNYLSKSHTLKKEKLRTKESLHLYKKEELLSSSTIDSMVNKNMFESNFSNTKDYDISTHNQHTKEVNEITPKELIERGISKLFLDEEKTNIQTKDYLAAFGIKVTEEKVNTSKKNNIQPTSKNKTDEYFTIKLGTIFEFKTRKRR